MENYLIKQILLEQHQEITRIFQQALITREVAPTFRKMLNSDLIKVIMGVRRCGKSVLAHQMLREIKYGYINFDDERLVGVKAEDLNDFLEVLKEIEPDFNHLFLDEVQNVLGWELFVNRLKRQGYQLIVSGSNSKLLSRELATHLTGRHFSLALFPFSFREFLLLRGLQVKQEHFYLTETRARIKRYLQEYLEFGGLPEVYKVEYKEGYLRELYDKIITRDILLRYNIKYARALKEIALLAISTFGSKISYHKIRKIFEIKSIHTVKNYLDYLEESYLLFLLHPFSFGLKNQFRHPKKIYCIDTGLIRAIVPKVTQDHGKLMENLVFCELKRRGEEIYCYWGPTYEVDFLIRKGLHVAQLIQVCYSLEKEETKKREIKAILKAGRELKCSDLLVITWDEEGEEKLQGRKIKILPLWKWLLA